MIFFENADVETTIKTKTKNKIGQLIESYKKTGDSYRINIQPIDERSYKYLWGEDIKASYQIYCDTALNIGDVIIVNSKTYNIEKKNDWINYKIYAILEEDIEVLENENSK